ncbi:MAG: nitric oxide reductase, partial [Nitrosomonas sp.]|nr:nitric oxide reductase [Nitrosomonas sp.]
MPEFVVGKLWDRFITGAAIKCENNTAVLFEDIAKPAGILFRALGGDAGLTLKMSQSTHHHGKRSWLQRIAGSEEKIELAWRDHDALYLPSRIHLFADESLNRELYFWLAALAVEMREGSWFAENQQATLRLLKKFPGLQARYQRLVDATLLCRPDIATLTEDNAAQEKVLRQALVTPGIALALPLAHFPWQPVHVWFHPFPPLNANNAANTPTRIETFEPSQNTQATPQDEKRHKAERQDSHERKDGFM